MAVEEKVNDKTIDEPEVDPLEAPEEVVDLEPLLEGEEGRPAPDPKMHPLHPGGIRFEQVYAKGKQAERDLAKERDLRIAAEAKLSVLDKGHADGSPTPKDGFVEYNWTQLEQFIVEGRITRADANAHREEVLRRNLSKEIKGDFVKETNSNTRTQVMQASIAQYVQAAPAVTQVGSEDRLRLDEEFDFLASVEGLSSEKIDDSTRIRLQLVALRNVYGPIDALTKRNSSTVQPDTHQGLPGGTRTQTRKNPDQEILDKLSKTEVAHYNKMFRAGRYPGGWKDVVAEIKFEVPKRVRR